MDFLEIKKLNPTLINNIFPSKYRLKANNIEANFLKSNQEKIFHFQDSMINDLFFNEDSQKKIIYKVKSGDFLGGIAEKNGVTTANLMNWNTLSSSTIYVGQELKIFSSDKFSEKNFNYYQINKENTFWEISSSLNTHSVLDLLTYNSFHDLKQKKQLRIIKK
jgi:LysM repeat protein